MGKKLTQDDIIKKIHDKFGDKFDCSKVVYKGIDENITLICPEHGEFKVKIKTMLQNKYGCSKCGYINATKQITSTTNDFIKKAREVHGDKYDYSKVEYKGCSEKVCIICPEHGEFWQIAKNHLRGRGCSKCCKTGVKLTTEEFISKAKQIYGDRYDYSKVEYVNSQTKVCIICKEHGEFWQTPNSHLNGNNCFKCKGKLITKKKTFTKETFVEKAKEVHGDRYDYTKVVYIKSKKPVCIICHKTFNNGEEHGEFWQMPDKHINGQHGCPKCSVINSKNEKDVFNYCSRLSQNIEENVHNIINPYELDIYLPDYKLAIEYNGLIWHSEKYGKDRNYHLNKLNECNAKGIKLIQIFEDEYLEHKDIVLSKIKHILGKDTDLPKIQARKCAVREITKEESRGFLNKNHIQGACNASIHLGCFQDNHLVGVMTFKEERKGNNRWELNRFATDITKRCIGVGGKLFNYFVKNYNPDYIKSFADRRWTLSAENNLYTKLGFKLGEVLKPEYRYFFNKRYGATRVHKFNFRKQTLLKKYPDEGLTEDMTEYEMTQKLGAYRIWDCGLFKFEWWKK